MKISAKEICGVYMISSSNSAAWGKISNAVDEAIKLANGARVVVDFKDVMLLEPWTNQEFKQFMANNKADIIVYNDDVANYVRTMCIAGGMGTDRVTLVELPKVETETKEEKNIKRMANEWQEIIELDPDKPHIAVLHLHKRLHALTNDKTIPYIREAIKLYHTNNPHIKSFVIQTNNLMIESFSVKSLGQMCHALRNRSDGQKLYVKLQNNNKDIENNYRISAALGNQMEFESDKRRILEIKKRLKEGRVGLLMAYTKTRATDVMGRSGSGEIKSCQPAIYNGLVNTSDGYKMRFTLYSFDRFYTPEHWAIMNDGEINKLAYRTVEIPVSKCGLHGVYLGREYHFSEPIQYHNGESNGTTTCYSIGDNQRTSKTHLTVPSYIKEVFDSYGVKYDKDYLNECIERTHKIIMHNDGELLAR